MSEPHTGDVGRHGGALRLYRYFGLITDAAAFVMRWSMVVAIAIMLGCVAFQVFMRYAFGRPPSWAEEIAVLMFSWAAMGALALGVREGFHVRMVAYRSLPHTLRTVWERLTFLLIGLFGIFLFWAGWRFVEFTAGARSAGARYPIELLHVMAPVSGALILLFALDGALSGREGTQPSIVGRRTES